MFYPGSGHRGGVIPYVLLFLDIFECIFLTAGVFLLSKRKTRFVSEKRIRSLLQGDASSFYTRREGAAIVFSPSLHRPTAINSGLRRRTRTVRAPVRLGRTGGRFPKARPHAVSICSPGPTDLGQSARAPAGTKREAQGKWATQKSSPGGIHDPYSPRMP
jgi:hypothetical protein